MFRIYLRGNEGAGQAGVTLNDSAVYHPELDNILSILDDLCGALEESRRVVFWVEGFGQSPWPVDVATDLSVCLSELPEVTGWLKHGGAGRGEWWFYEQGVERYLVLERAGEAVRVGCVGFGDWKPSPDVEFVAYELFWSMVRDLVRVFHAEARELCPRTIAHEWYQRWYRSVELE